MLILIGRGLDLKEESELRKQGTGAKRKRGKRNERKVVAEEFEVNFHCAVFRVWKEIHNRIRISGDNGKREPPVPIPNTEVKPLSADGTWLETARESRSSPDSKGYR